MRLFTMLKRNSKLALRGSFGRAIIILLITMGVSTMLSALAQIAMGIFATPTDYVAVVPDGWNEILQEMLESFRMSPAEWIITLIVTVISVLFIAPVSLGAIRWYYNLVCGVSLPITELFHFFESGKLYVRSISYEINLSIRALLWMVLFYVPPSAIFGISMFFLSRGEELPREAQVTATTGIFLSVVLFILATLFYAAFICRYTLTPYLISEDGDLTVQRAIKLSVQYTKGFRFSLLWFAFSYLGWFLLTAFVFPMFYVIPYYSTGMAMYSRFILEKNRGTVPEATQEVAVNGISGEATQQVGIQRDDTDDGE